MAEETPTIGSILNSLASRENRVIREIYGIETDRLTPEEIGRNLPRQTMGTDGKFVGLSRTRVLSIASTALRKLRHPTRSRLLKLIIQSGNTPAGVLDLVREVLPPKTNAEVSASLPEPATARSSARQKGKLIVMQPH